MYNEKSNNIYILCQGAYFDLNPFILVWVHGHVYFQSLNLSNTKVIKYIKWLIKLYIDIKSKKKIMSQLALD